MWVVYYGVHRGTANGGTNAARQRAAPVLLPERAAYAQHCQLRQFCTAVCFDFTHFAGHERRVT